MLFLAFTLGFFVENQREHFIEHQREIAYIRSLAGDLKKDTASINQTAIMRNTIRGMVDSLLIRGQRSLEEKGSITFTIVTKGISPGLTSSKQLHLYSSFLEIIDPFFDRKEYNSAISMEYKYP